MKEEREGALGWQDRSGGTTKREKDPKMMAPGKMNSRRKVLDLGESAATEGKCVEKRDIQL